MAKLSVWLQVSIMFVLQNDNSLEVLVVTLHDWPPAHES